MNNYDYTEYSERHNDSLPDVVEKTPPSGRNLPPGLREAPEENDEEIDYSILESGD